MCLRKMCKNTSPYVSYDGPALRSGSACSHFNVANLFRLENDLLEIMSDWFVETFYESFHLLF